MLQLDIQTHIRDVISETLNESNGKEESLTEDGVLRALKEKGIVDNLMQQLQLTSTNGLPLNGLPVKKATHFVDKDEKFASSDAAAKTNIDPTRRYLYMQFLGGKAFLEHLQETDALPGQVTSTFTLHINFRGQRFKSRPVPCACEPDLHEAFLLELHKDASGDAARMADATTLLSLGDSVHLVLIKTEATGESVLVASHYLEWRSVLAAPHMRCSMAVELMGIGSENKVPVGVLDVKLELIPRLSVSLTEDVITEQVRVEKSRQAEHERLFLVYAKQWWKEFLQIRTTHKERLIKIFAQDENGTNRPVCSYVRPLRAGRMLDTPRQAARFVSLLAYEKVTTLGGGGRGEQWTSMHAFLCRNKGDCEDHAVLLCCLLLGFGLDAFVCVGTKGRGATHSWVVTISSDLEVTFWESLTGHRYLHRAINPNDPPAVPQPKPAYPYKTIGCVFNHQNFYANCQPTDAVELCDFDLVNDARWKAMSEDAVKSVCGHSVNVTWPCHPPLCPSSLDAGLVSNDLERELRALILQHRRDQGLTSAWDDHLSYLLTPALAAYETERVTGLTAGNEEFQQAIRRAVPEGHTFKGYPIQFVHRNARRAFAACLKSPIFEEIVNCRGDHVRLAVRVRVFMYPESACATWMMFACKYRCVL
ncbi:hypothetical protein NP493_55g07029 [Ridgeia piscesae]|uniref:Centrosomal protein of 76 kDa n=1 Tax=Ridgeia piscesae TaxID=27915 RepID=A0AAD9UIY0_RIDPI|nr:hypothetical protein NP493_55g07029 [Ridgeia piscesae]